MFLRKNTHTHTDMNIYIKKKESLEDVIKCCVLTYLYFLIQVHGL